MYRPLRCALCLYVILLAVGLEEAHTQVEQQRTADTARSAEPASAGLNSQELARVAVQIVDRTNRFRDANELEPVRVNAILSQTAQDFADYMAKEYRYSHTADGRTPAERAAAQGYEYCLVSENIAYQWSSAGFSVDELAAKFETGWEESPAHRENMLNPHVTEIGVAVARNSQHGVYFAVQMFGRPSTLAIEVEVENRADVEIKYTLGDDEFALPPRYVRTHHLCVPATLLFAFQQPAESSLKPRNGDRFVVTAAADGKLAVARNASQTPTAKGNVTAPTEHSTR